MLKMFTCPRGHTWESTGEPAEPRCPECGAPPDVGLLLESPEPPTSPAPEPPLVDDAGLPVVTGYDDLHELGRGTGGVRLYRARQKVVGRPVLLQVVLARDFNSERAWNYLRGQASAHGKLAHPNIVSVHEVGERDRLLFFNAMEYVDGPTLAEAAGEKPLPVRQIAPLVELLARAVAHAHERRIIHRHLEPSAVLLQKVSGPGVGPAKNDPGGAACRIHDEYYIPRIHGFGLARPAVEGDVIDADLFAEPGYLSPEQASGRASLLGPHTDVYGLGGILYFLLCGRAPYRGPSEADVVDAVLTAPLAPPSQVRRVPASLAFVCSKALARRKSGRYPGAAEMADDLRRVARNIPPQDSNLGLLRRADLFCRRHPARVLLMGVVLWGVWSIMVLASKLPQVADDHQRELKEQALQRAVAEQIPLRRERDELLAWAFHKEYRHQLRAVLAADADDKAAMTAALERCPEAERGFEWHYLRGRRRENAQWVLPDSLGTDVIAWNGEGRAILATARWSEDDRQSTLTVWNVSRKKRIRRLTYPERIIALSWVGKSSRLALVTGSIKARLSFLEENGQQTWVQPTLRAPTTLATRSDGGSLVIANQFRLLQFHSPQTGEPLGPTFLTGDLHDQRGLMQVAYRPDGGALATFVVGEVGVLEWHDSEPPALIRNYPSEDRVTAIAYGSKGHLAIACADKMVAVHDTSTGQRMCLLPALPRPVKQVAFCPSGTRLALAREGGGVHILALHPPLPERVWVEQQARIRVREEPGWVANRKGWSELLTIPVNGERGLAFGPDDKTLAVLGPRGVVVLGDFSE